MTMKKKSIPASNNAAELGGNLRKTNTEKIKEINGQKIKEINGQLVMDRDMEFKGYLIVRGDIVGKDGERYNLEVNGRLYVAGSIYIRNLDIKGNTEVDGNIDVWGNIRAKGNIIAYGYTKVTGNIDVWGEIYTRKLYVLSENIRRHGVKHWLDLIRRQWKG